MTKTILITGSTDGIGLETARMMVSRGHHVLLHGRNPSKLEDAERALGLPNGGQVESHLADLSRLEQVAALANAVAERHASLDALINNAGIYRASTPATPDGLDPRFVVNTVAPYLLTRRLLPLLGSSRVINVSSAAQAPVDPAALAGRVELSDAAAYAQSKLALIMWSRSLAVSLGATGPAIIAVNPGSMLGTKMVRQAFGVAGADIRIGAEILTRAALEDEFAAASGQYFDNDSGTFAAPHPDAVDSQKSDELVRALDAIVA